MPGLSPSDSAPPPRRIVRRPREQQRVAETPAQMVPPRVLQRRLVDEAETARDRRAADVRDVAADLDAAGAELAEREVGDRAGRLGDESAALEPRAAPVADLEARDRPVDAVQPA